MYTRIAQCTIKPGRQSEFNRVLNREILPELAKQPGFVDAVQLHGDSDPSEFTSITFWNSKEQADHYGRDVFPLLTAKLETLSYNFTVEDYKVELSTMHQIAAGKAA